MSLKPTKKFTPYGYNISYRSPGSSPTQAKPEFVSSGSLGEEVLVAREKPARYRWHITKTAYYYTTDKCELKWNNSNISFSIADMKKHENYEYQKTVYQYDEYHIKSVKIIVTKEASDLYYWDSRVSVVLKHNLNGIVDYVARYNGVNRIITTDVEVSADELRIVLPDELPNGDYIEVIVYLLSTFSNDLNNNFAFEEFVYDPITNNMESPNNLSEELNYHELIVNNQLLLPYTLPYILSDYQNNDQDDNQNDGQGTITRDELYERNAYIVNNSLGTKKVNSIVRSSLGTRVKFHNIITTPTTIAFITPLTQFYSREIINTIILYKSYYIVTKKVILDKDSYGVIWTTYKNHKAVILNHNLNAIVNVVIRTITGESFRYSDIILNENQVEIILPEDFSVSSFNVDIFPIHKE